MKKKKDEFREFLKFMIKHHMREEKDWAKQGEYGFAQWAKNTWTTSKRILEIYGKMKSKSQGT